MQAYDLSDLGVLRIHGADAGKFLQGQLSNDVTRLTVGTAQLQGLHNPQGRVLAVLRLWREDETNYFAILPRELLDTVRSTLARLVFRAKLALEDVSSQWFVYGATHANGSSRQFPIDTAGRVWSLHNTPLTDLAPREQWRALDIAAGLPQVYLASSGVFVAQMLNLDVLGGIAFDKGCYTGQEIIARAHYRGRVKRRMQRFQIDAAQTPAPGGMIALADGSQAQVVEAVSAGSGFAVLAVAAFGSGNEHGDGNAAPNALALPYALPA